MTYIPIYNLVQTIFFSIEAPIIIPLNFGFESVNEGAYGQLVCSVIQGDPPFSFTWSLQGDIVHSEPGLNINQLGGRTSILTISSVGHRHTGQYTCTVANQAGQVSETAELKVNG